MDLKKMTKEDAIKLVANIENCKGDDEMAHSKEDDLRAWFIECVAAGMYTKKEHIEIGSIVVTTKSISFARWCA